MECKSFSKTPILYERWRLNDKLTAMHSQSTARSQRWTTVLTRTGSISAPDVNSTCTGNNQPWQKAYCGIPTRIHPHLPGLTLNQYTTWLAAQKARTSSRGHHRGVCIIQCGGWLRPVFSTLFAIRVNKRHWYRMMEWACCWCQIVKQHTSLHKLILIINFVRKVEGNSTTMQSRSMVTSTRCPSLWTDNQVVYWLRVSPGRWGWTLVRIP